MMGFRSDRVVVVALAGALLALYVVVNEYLYVSLDSKNPVHQDGREFITPDSGVKGTVLAFHDFETGDIGDSSLHLVSGGYNGRQSLRMNGRVPFSPGLWVRFGDLNVSPGAWLRTTAFVRYDGSPGDVKYSLVTTCNQNGMNYRYQNIPLELEQLKPRVWNKVIADYRIPQPALSHDVLQVYLWYRGGCDILIDDLSVVMFSDSTTTQTDQTLR
jgi:hypothetical protein